MTKEIIKSIEDGRPTREGGYTIRLKLQNGAHQDIDIAAASVIDAHGVKRYVLGARES